MNTPISKSIIEKYNIDEQSDLARSIRSLEKSATKQQNEKARMKVAMVRIREEMKTPASNRQFMQVARPARTVLNLVKPFIG